MYVIGDHVEVLNGPDKGSVQLILEIHGDCLVLSNGVEYDESEVTIAVD